MLGRVRTNERCPFGCRFDPITLECAVHRTRPRRYYVDVSGFKLSKRKHYSDRDEKPFASREHAEQYLSAMRSVKGSKTGWDAAEWDKKSIREFRFEAEWEKWVASREAEWSSRYRRQVETWREKVLSVRWGGMDVRDIRSGHLIDLKTEVSKQYAPSSVKLIIGIACSFLNEMRRRGDIKEVIVRPTVKVPQRDLWILSREQQETIIKDAPKRYRMIYRLMAATGVRSCEAAALLVKDISNGHIFFCRSMDEEGKRTDETKTGAIIRKQIPAELHDELMAAMRDKTPAAYVFTNKAGTPFRPCYLSREWIKAARKNGYDIELRMATRHSFATRTWKEEEKVARERTAKAVGHTGPTVTFRHYVQEG